MSAALRASWLAAEEIEGLADLGLGVLARNDGVEESGLEQKFGGLKTFGEFLADGLLDDARTGETDERARFGNVEVAEHGVTGVNATSLGIGEQRNEG